MTYVEFFDTTAAENITACLTYAPQRVIYIGDNAKLMKRHIRCYERVFRDRGYQIEFIVKTVSKSNLDSAVALLTDIVEQYDDCVFDITGGEEILNMALGIVCERYPDKNVQIHRFNLRNNTVADCDKDGCTIYRQPPQLSVAENVRIYGGDIVYGGIWESQTYLWDLNEDFVSDIQNIWSVCKGNVRQWNIQLSIFQAAEAVGEVSNEGLTTTARISELETYLSRQKASYKCAKGMVKALCKYGLLTAFWDDGNLLTVSYKNQQVKRCLTKAGQALEMKIFLTAKLLEEDGVAVYNDAVNGAVIDWDGEFHDDREEGVYDTENEVDILLMHDVVPVFISCKNGRVTADELYKLNTVAERFGGEYAKKVLVATAISTLGETGEYLRQRAQDMHIRLIENIQEMDDDTLAKKLKNLWRS